MKIKNHQNFYNCDYASEIDSHNGYIEAARLNPVVLLPVALPRAVLTTAVQLRKGISNENYCNDIVWQFVLWFLVIEDKSYLPAPSEIIGVVLEWACRECRILI